MERSRINCKRKKTLNKISKYNFSFFKSDDEASDAESEKEIERNLMLQKEQVRKKNVLFVKGFKWMI